MMTHLYVDTIVIVAWYVPSLSVCQAVWRVSLFWLDGFTPFYCKLDNFNVLNIL